MTIVRPPHWQQPKRSRPGFVDAMDRLDDVRECHRALEAIEQLVDGRMMETDPLHCRAELGALLRIVNKELNARLIEASELLIILCHGEEPPADGAD